MLAKQVMAAERGSGIVPMNVGAELYDYVKMTDAREDDFVIGNVGYIKETCKPGNDAREGFSMQFGFGRLQDVNALGLLTEPALMGGTESIGELWEYVKALAIFVEGISASLNGLLIWLNAVIPSLTSTGIPFIIHGGGSVITTGYKGHTFIPFAGEIIGVILGADQVGDIVIDIWKCPIGDFPPLVADTITASAKPTLTNQQGIYAQGLIGGTWKATRDYVVNNYVQPVTPNGDFSYRCTTAGTSGESEPTWPVVAGQTVNDGTAVWTAVANGLLGWTTTCAYLDCIGFNCDSVADIQQITIELIVRRT